MPDRRPQLEKLLETDGDDAFVTYALAFEHLKAGDADAALRWLDRTLEIEPATPYAYFQQAKVHQSRGDAAAAVAAADAGVACAEQAGDAKALSELRELRSMLG